MQFKKHVIKWTNQIVLLKNFIEKCFRKIGLYNSNMFLCMHLIEYDML
jgi:hypothetical protein